jgi:hypothetical protein
VERGGGLGFVCIISLFTFERSIALSLITLYFCIKHTFPMETILRNAPKGGKPDRKPYHPYGLRNPYKIINEENSSLFLNSIFCRKA